MSGPLVIYNGATGGLGQHLDDAFEHLGLSSVALTSRLGEERSTVDELDRLDADDRSRIVFVQAAAMVSIEACESDVGAAHEVNVHRTKRTMRTVVETLVKRGASVASLFVSSGHVYAASRPGHRLRESAPLGPRSVYARTKLSGEQAASRVMRAHGGDLVVARVFGMLGPGQRPSYLLPGLVRRALENRWHEIPGLEFVRDYLDARDVAAHVAGLARHMAFGRDVAPVVNVCSGEEVRVREIMELVLHALGIDPSEVSLSAAAGRPTDVPWVVGDPSILRSLTAGPVRQIPLHRTIADASTAV